jgi:hypothetical protein
VIATAVAAVATVLVPASPAWVQISTEELLGGYDELWAVSDIHGRRQELEHLLFAARLVVREGAGLRWSPASRRQLLVVVGDLIDGGPDSAGVVRLLEKLQTEAPGSGSRLVVLLGNHEAAFLAKHAGDQSPFAHYLRSLPIAAWIGSWLFAHSGYIDTEDTDEAVTHYLEQLARPWPPDYRALLGSRSILETHHWSQHRRERERMKALLERLNLTGLLFGHDPDALDAPATIAMDAGGSFVKLDTGLKTLQSTGLLLRCEVPELVHGKLLALRRQGGPTCHALGPDGTLRHLLVK